MKALRPIPEFTEKDKARFWARVDKNGPIQPHTPNLGKCWVFIGVGHLGYGKMSIRNIHIQAHRISWKLHQGEIPEGFLVLHKCDNRSCVNNSHLFLGTYADNNKDMYDKRRSVHFTCPERLGFGRKITNTGPKGEDHCNSKLDNEQIIKIRSMYIPYKFSTVRLSKIFGVTQAVIWEIVNRKAWKHIK